MALPGMILGAGGLGCIDIGSRIELGAREHLVNACAGISAMPSGGDHLVTNLIPHFCGIREVRGRVVEERPPRIVKDIRPAGQACPTPFV